MQFRLVRIAQSLFIGIVSPDWSLWSRADWMGQVLVHWSKVKTSNSFIRVDSDGINEQGIMQEAKGSD